MKLNPVDAAVMCVVMVAIGAVMLTSTLKIRAFSPGPPLPRREMPTKSLHARVHTVSLADRATLEAERGDGRTLVFRESLGSEELSDMLERDSPLLCMISGKMYSLGMEGGHPTLYSAAGRSPVGSDTPSPDVGVSDMLAFDKTRIAVFHSARSAPRSRSGCLGF